MFFDLVKVSNFSDNYKPFFSFLIFKHKKLQFSCFLGLLLERDIHPFFGIGKGHSSQCFSHGVFETIMHFMIKHFYVYRALIL